MSDSRTRSPDADRIALEASEWVVRFDRGLTAEEQDTFSAWLAADPQHGEWLARRRQEWRAFDLLAEWRPEHSAEPNSDLLAAAPASRPRRLWFPLALAAAASVAVGLAIWQPWREVGPAPTPQVEVAQTHESRVLDDGTVVEFNRGAAIEVDFTPAERRVRLVRGEVHFKVAKNPQRPFLVAAGGVDVRAVGTAFDVMLGVDTVEVIVTEGQVKVSPPTVSPTGDPAVPSTPLVTAGQRAIVSLVAEASLPRVVDVTPDEMTRRLGWRAKLLDFDATPLAQVVAEFNRRNRTQLVIADPALATIPIVASFRPDNVDGFVRLLELTTGVRGQREGNTIVLRLAAPPQSR